MENKYVIFKIENEYYGLNIENVQSIEKFQNYTRVPNAPKYVKGVINLRGEVVPILDLRIKLNLNPKEVDNNTRIVIAKQDELVIGLIVDASSEVLEISKDNIDKPPTNGDDEYQEYIKGIGKDKDRLVIIIDLEKLLE